MADNRQFSSAAQWLNNQLGIDPNRYQPIKPITPQALAWGGTGMGNTGYPPKPIQPFNMTGNGWNNPAVTTNAFKGTGVPAGPSIPSVRQYDVSAVPQVVSPNKNMVDYSLSGGSNAQTANQVFNSSGYKPNFDSLSGFGSLPNMDTYQSDQNLADSQYFAGMSGVATNPMNAMTSAAAVNQPWYNSGMFEGMLGTKDAPGWGGLALGTANSLLSGYMGMKQYGLAKDSFDESKKQFWSNFNVQKDLTNNDITDRNIARNASREGSTNPYVDTKRIA